MSNIVIEKPKVDLFAPKKRKPKGGPHAFKRAIPQNSSWHKKHGSWAVKMGIFNDK